MRPKHLVPFLIKCMDAGLPVLLKGPPGVGKTAMCFQAAEQSGREAIYMEAGTSDATRLEGMPWINPQEGEAKFFAFGELAKASRATKPTLLLIDDLGWAMLSVQNAAAHLIHERRTPSGLQLPDCVTIIATTNERTHKAGVGGFSEPVKSRFNTIVAVEVNADDSCDHIMENYPKYRITEEACLDGVGWIRQGGPDALHKFEPTADLTNSVCPRTVVNALQICSLGLPPAQELEGVQGAAGAGWAAGFMAYRRMREELPPIDSILLNPDTAKIPENTSALWLVAKALAVKATTKNFTRIRTYVERLYKAQHGEFVTLLIKEATKLTPLVTNTIAYQQMILTDIGKLINGETE